MPFDFSSYLVASGEKPASSAKFNNFLNAVQAALNAFPPANLTGFPSDASKFLNGAGGWSIPVTDMAAVYVKNTPTDITTAGGQDLFANAIAIAAGKMGPSAGLKIFASGDYQNNSGANRTIDLALQLGAQTLWQAISDTITSSANRRSWWFHAVIQAMTASSQIGGGFFSMGDNNPVTAGLGRPAALDGGGKFGNPLTTIGGTVNMAGSQTLKLVCTHGGGALTNVSMRCNFARIEVTA